MQHRHRGRQPQHIVRRGHAGRGVGGDLQREGKNEGEIPRKYYEANREKFEEATAKGMAQSQNPNIADDKEFLKKYRHSIDVFSAFRSHTYAKRLADELYDSEGRLRPFEEWRKATESIQSHFNKSWLQTEYNMPY